MTSPICIAVPEVRRHKETPQHETAVFCCLPSGFLGFHRHFAGTVGALGGFVVDRHLAEGAETVFLLGGFFLLGQQLGHGLHQHEDAEGDDEEVQNHLQEIAVTDSHLSGLHGYTVSSENSFLQNDLPLGNVQTAHGQAYQRHDDVRHQAGGDLTERAADYNTDCHVDYAALRDKRLELLEKLFHFKHYGGHSNEVKKVICCFSCFNNFIHACIHFTISNVFFN